MCGALGHLHITGAIVALDELLLPPGPYLVGRPVAQAARRAVQEIAAARPKQGDDEFERVSALLQRQPTDEQ